MSAARDERRARVRRGIVERRVVERGVFDRSVFDRSVFDRSVFERSVVVAAIFVVVVALVSSCGVVAVRPTPGPPRRVTYVDPHGRPRAYGGGVCPLRGRHEHAWLPTPPTAFVDDGGAWRDTRAIVSFSGPHPLGGRRCSTAGWHQHALATTAATKTTPAR